ncbi:hypothetical protein NDU88_003616 [Pleurodeles waltl]|uniref:Uncharacterized protein n=1 Tax=Pleurodeles waltl TaxID=8319 RepID=A0AAV7KW41_PLEWA|nr:hypothetical protein NDU88_003616 [Pleurodeles waltl]
MPVPDRSDVEWRIGPVFMVIPVEEEPMHDRPASTGVHHTAWLESRCPDRVPSLGRNRAHLDDAPRDARHPSLHLRDSGKLSPVACSHRVPSRDALKRW